MGNNILGTNESISDLKCETMRDDFGRRYSPGNITVAATGNVDFEAFTEKVSQMCSSWQSCDVSRQTPPVPPNTHQEILCDPKVVREHIGLMSPAPSNQDDRRYTAQIAATIIGDVTGSRLYYALIEPAIADEAKMAYDGLDQAGAFMTFISADPDNAPKAIRIARAELEKFMEHGPTDTELQAAQNKIASGATLTGELPMGRLTAVGFDWVYRNDYTPLAGQIEKVFAVTCDDILALVRQYDLTELTTLALGPLEKL